MSPPLPIHLDVLAVLILSAICIVSPYIAHSNEISRFFGMLSKASSMTPAPTAGGGTSTTEASSGSGATAESYFSKQKLAKAMVKMEQNAIFGPIAQVVGLIKDKGNFVKRYMQDDERNLHFRNLSGVFSIVILSLSAVLYSHYTTEKDDSGMWMMSQMDYHMLVGICILGAIHLLVSLIDFIVSGRNKSTGDLPRKIMVFLGYILIVYFSGSAIYQSAPPMMMMTS